MNLRSFREALSGGRHRKQPPQPRWSGWQFLFPLITALSVAWFLLRVIPKPIRATYPCQQAAFPLLSTFVIWLLGLKCGVVAWLHAKQRVGALRQLALAVGALLVLGLAVWAKERSVTPKGPLPNGITWGTPSGDPPNSPMGVAKGIFPGRVTWIRDTNATPWNGTTGYWWQDTNGVNQAVVDHMISMSLRALTEGASDAEAWDRIFRQYNSTHGRGDVGYGTNERIALKINLNNDYNTDGNDNYPETSKQTVLALLRQLVNKAGVAQTNISVYDAVRRVPTWLYNGCQTQFPAVQWYSVDGYPPALNNWRNRWATNSSQYSISNGCGTSLVVAECVSQATYLINVPLLKGHNRAGITLSAKNHYGSIPNRDHSAYLDAWRTNTPLYSMLVDLQGSQQLGGKTILYVDDALFANVAENYVNSLANSAFSNLFNGQWPASIFMSFDPVAIDSVCADFLYAEFGSRLGTNTYQTRSHGTNCDHYLHEAALADNPPSGAVYQPDGVRLSSLGVHEHWNNPIDKQYSRNLSTKGTGIELLALHDIPPAVLTITSPTNGALFSGASDIPLQASATTNYSAIRKVDFYANGVLVGTSSNAPFTVPWRPSNWGNWTLSAVGTDSEAYCTTSPVVKVYIGVSVAITNPLSGTTVMEGTNLMIEACASSAFGPIIETDFYANNLLLGADTQAPFGIIWSNVPAGSWALAAAALDAVGSYATSALVNIEAKRDIRVALLEPPSGAVFPPATAFTLQASANSPVSAIARVDFYCTEELIGTVTNSPYALVWSNPPPGVSLLTAVATDTAGFSNRSTTASVTVKPNALRTAGTLYVDLRATNCSPDCAVWTNVALLGNFQGQIAPTFDANAANTGLPACRFWGTNWMSGPAAVADVEGSSDRSLELWVLRPAPLDGQGAMMIWGYSSSSFIARYDTNLQFGAFSQNYLSTTYSIGWGSQINIPAPNSWHHIVYTYDGAYTMLVYVDGAVTLAKKFYMPLNTGSVGEPGMALGYSYNGNAAQTLYLNGYLNSVRVHGGQLTTNDVLLNYLAGPCEWQSGPVAIATQPQDCCVAEGSSATLLVVPGESVPLSYQWYRDGVLILGATNSSYSLPNLQWADSGAQFCCLLSRSGIKNSCTAYTRLAAVTVQPQLPAFTSCVASNAQLTLNFTATVGGNYQVEYKENLDGPTWTLLTFFQPATNGVVEVRDIVVSQNRFYRIRRVP